MASLNFSCFLPFKNCLTNIEKIEGKRGQHNSKHFAVPTIQVTLPNSVYKMRQH